MRLRRNEKILPPVHPNAGISAIYRKKLRALIEEMSRSYDRFLKAQYRRTPPVMAQDESPAKELEKELRRLGAQWRKRFEAAAPALAAWFSKSVSGRSDAALRQILKDAGISVEFQMTRAMRDILNATVAANVSMIKSIGSEYHTQIEGLVMRSMTAGRDLGKLAKSLWDVGRLAEIVQALSYMCYNQIMEEELEEDADSPLPSLLAENVDTLLDTLLQMVEEEAQEVRDDLHSRVR